MTHARNPYEEQTLAYLLPFSLPCGWFFIRFLQDAPVVDAVGAPVVDAIGAPGSSAIFCGLALDSWGGSALMRRP